MALTLGPIIGRVGGTPETKDEYVDNAAGSYTVTIPDGWSTAWVMFDGEYTRSTSGTTTVLDETTPTLRRDDWIGGNAYLMTGWSYTIGPYLRGPLKFIRMS